MPQANQTIQLQAPSPTPIQQLQVLPMTALPVSFVTSKYWSFYFQHFNVHFRIRLQTSGCSQIVIPQQAQILQTPDGQTYIYQPTPTVQVENTIPQPTVQPTCKICSYHLNWSFSSGYLELYSEYSSINKKNRDLIFKNFVLSAVELSYFSKISLSSELSQLSLIKLFQSSNYTTCSLRMRSVLWNDRFNKFVLEFLYINVTICF